MSGRTRVLDLSCQEGVPEQPRDSVQQSKSHCNGQNPATEAQRAGAGGLGNDVLQASQRGGDARRGEQEAESTSGSQQTSDPRSGGESTGASLAGDTAGEVGSGAAVHSASSRAVLQDEPEEWERTWGGHASRMERVREEAARNPPQLSVPNRVNQLEAAELDKELIDMLFVQLNRVFALFRPSLLEAFQPELEALFRSTVFYFSIWSGGQTPGNYFQNLVFVDGRRLPPHSLKGRPPSLTQRRFHAVLFVLLPWLWARGSRFLSAREWGARPRSDWRRRIWGLVQGLEALHKCATAANLLLFLRYGRFRSVGERALGIRLLPKEANLTRSLNFDYMNQVLLWNSFQQLFEALRPALLSNVHRLKRLLLSLPSLFPAAPALPAPDAPPVPLSACGICHADPPHTPHHGSCSHAFCYYCLRSALVSNPRGFACPRCHVTLATCQRVTWDAPPSHTDGGSAGGEGENQR